MAIYKTAPPADADFWAAWIPEIVIEVVSPGGEQRDYFEKREEYLRFGIQEYWILDAQKREMLVPQRAVDRWSEQLELLALIRPGIQDAEVLPLSVAFLLRRPAPDPAAFARLGGGFLSYWLHCVCPSATRYPRTPPTASASHHHFGCSVGIRMGVQMAAVGGKDGIITPSLSTPSKSPARGSG
ncbi:MAG: Uma2 family endonuclease [Planctomycetia bacterium]|nr:Uma2 family endonuclease [Planctomycetia bacterium]